MGCSPRRRSAPRSASPTWTRSGGSRRATGGEAAAACYSVDDFLSSPRLPLGPDERSRLLGLLGLYGIGVALATVNSGVRGATSLLKALRVASGIDDLLAQLDRQFVALADPLRARTAMRALDAVGWRGGDAASVAVLTAPRSDLDAVRGHYRLRQLDLMLSLADLKAGKVDRPTGKRPNRSPRW